MKSVNVQVGFPEVPHIFGNIVVGAPGDILGLIKTGTLSVKHLKYIVVNDCDDIVKNLQSKRELRKILQEAPDERQMMMFCSEDVRLLCRQFLRDPIEYSADEDGARINVERRKAEKTLEEIVISDSDEEVPSMNEEDDGFEMDVASDEENLADVSSLLDDSQ